MISIDLSVNHPKKSVKRARAVRQGLRGGLLMYSEAGESNAKMGKEYREEMRQEDGKKVMFY